MAAVIDIRRARPEEFDAIDELIRQAYAHDYGPSDESGDPMHRARVRAEDFDVWVAVEGEASLLGSVTTRRRGGPSLHEDVAPDELDLRLLGVSPAARRRGIGAALMGHVASEASRSGFDWVFLKTAPNMRGAHRLYEQLGFARVPDRDGLWIGGNKVLDLFSYRSAASAEDGSARSAQHAKQVLGSFPSGVVAVAARDASGAEFALTAQSFISLSLDPLRIAVAVGRSSTSWPRIEATGSFAITVFSEQQSPIARRLARPGTGKLAEVPTSAGPALGHPLIAGGVAWLECEIFAVHDGGDYHLVVADVRDLGRFEQPRSPLVFADSRFAALAEL
ncbi:MAG: GNAT family N-acetyltransferase [Actinobacteria bacterium]|nr:GNAT family N-acetyltransferase [Actinomycetota bacterium]